MNKLDDKYIEMFQKENLKTCFGIDSQTKDKQYILFWDFDNVELKNVEKALYETQKTYKLSNIYIIKSDSGFNAVCLDKFNFNQMYRILKQTELIDKIFVKMILHRRNSTLRFNGNKKIIEILKGESRFQKSKAHIIFFTEYLDYYIEQQYPVDNLYNVRFTAYHSLTKGYDNVTI